MPGDVNGDGATNAIDAELVLQEIAGFMPASARADVNGDSAATAIDAAVILQFDAGLLASLPD